VGAEATIEERERTSWLRSHPAAVRWVALYFVFQTLAVLLKLPMAAPPWVILTTQVALIAAYMFLSLAMLAALAEALSTRAAAAVAIAIGLAAWFFFAWLRRQGLPSAAGVLAFNMLDLGRALAAAGLGVLIASILRDANILLPAAVFAAFADCLMVYSSRGTVHKALQTEQGQKVIQSMSAHVPAPHPSIMPLTVGMADYVFLAFFFACVYRFGMNRRATFNAFFVALSLALILVPFVKAIPALAPMALAFVAVNFRHFRLSRSEMQAMAVVLVIVLLAVAGLYLFTR
jgi:hypothetical protein